MNNILKPLYESTIRKGNVRALLTDVRNHYRILDTYTSYDDNRDLLDFLITSYLKGKSPKQFIYIELINNKPVYKLPREMTTYTKFVEKLDAFIKELADDVGNRTVGAIAIDIVNKQLSTMFATMIPEYLAKSPNEKLYFVFHSPEVLDNQEYQLFTKNWAFIHELMHALYNTTNERLVQEETFKLMYNVGLEDELKLITATMFVLDVLGHITSSAYTITDYIIDVLVDEDQYLLAEIMGVVYELAIIHNVEAVREAAVSILNILDEYDERELETL